MHTFSWDFIYAEYVMAAGYHHQSIVWQIAEDYSHCEFLIRLPGYCPMPAFRDMIDVPLVVLRLHKSRKEVRSEMGISEDVKLVILNFGGQPAGWKLKEDYLPRGWLCLHLEELGTDQWPVLLGNRSLRCTGVALSVAAGLLAACVSGTGGRIVALVCGPCTEGHGSIVSQDLSDPVRSHKDIDKDAAVYFRKVVQFYEDLSKQMVSQVGVAEMKVLIERIGGLVVLSESFGHSVFRDSFRRVFESGEDSLGLSYNGTLEMNCSKDIKIQGIIGPCTSLEKKGPSVASTIIGQGNTMTSKLCGLDKDTCLTVLFDISSSDKPDNSGNSNPQLYLQTVTSYHSIDGQSSRGTRRLKTVTIQDIEFMFVIRLSLNDLGTLSS